MPHRDQVEPLAAEILLVEQAAAEIDTIERGMRAEILEIHTAESRAVPGSHFLQKRSDGATDVEDVAFGEESHIPAHELVLLSVVPVHRPVEEAGEHAPVAFLPMGDVLVVVVRFDVIDGESRVLIPQAAPRTGDEREAARLSGEIILRGD